MAWQTVLCSLLVAVALVSGDSIVVKECSGPDNSATFQPGSKAMLGGIISLNGHGSNGYGCGSPEGSFQSLEAMRWVLDLLNKKDEYLRTEYLDDTYVPGVTLGMKVIDNCASRSGALASIEQVYESFNGDSEQCVKQSSEMVFGIVGGSSSDIASDLSLAMKPHDIPLISYEATAPQLTLDGMHTNFMRTIAPDSQYAEVILRVMVDLNWKFVTVVYDTGRYGREAYSELHTRMVNSGLCLTLGVPVDSEDTSSGAVDNILNTILSSEATGVVYFGSDALMLALVERANERMSETGKLQWIFSNFPIDGALNIPYMRGVISITSAYRFIVEFEDQWVRIEESAPPAENPWLKSFFEKKFSCSYAPVGNQKDCRNLYPGLTAEEREIKRREVFQQDQYVEPAVMAIFTYAKALRMAQADKCTTKTACPELVNMDRNEFYEKYLKKVDFTFTSEERVSSLASRNVESNREAKHLSFTEEGDIVDPSFYIWNYNDIEAGQQSGNYKFRVIGNYQNKYLDLDTRKVAMYNEVREVRLVPNPTSLCPSDPCYPCQGLPADVKYYYEHGDIVINGIFSLHDKGSNPMSCGKLKSPNQVMYLEAMIYALKQVNSDNSLLPNIKLGGLGIDDCSSKAVSQAFISQVQRGTFKVHDRQNNFLNPHSVEAYTGSHTSPLTDPLAEMMNYMKHPLVGYRAGSTKLDNRMKYPYFIRSSPYIQEEVHAIILLLKYYHYMHVQMITSEGHYAKDAHETFIDLAAKEGICVVATHNLGDSEDEAEHAVQALAFNKDVPVTVALLEMYDQHRLLKALHGNQAVKAQIRLIASTGWGDNEMLVKGMESTAEGVMSLSVRHSPLTSFQAYLRTLRVDDHAVNPWFMDWFMAAYDCHDGMQNCNITQILNNGPSFHMLYEVESVINGIEAIARALHSTLNHYCNPGYQSICSAFTNAPERGLKFMEFLRATDFVIEDLAPERFSFHGSSPAIPFKVNHFTRGSYREMGIVYPWRNDISITDSFAPSGVLVTKCPEPCIECLYMFNHQDYMYRSGAVFIGIIANVHHAGDGPFMCGDLRLHNGALYTEVINFAFNQINAGRASVKMNVDLGFIGFDGCSNPTRAQSIISRVTSGSINFDGMNLDVMSWLTYDSETTKNAALFLQQLGIPLVSPGATLPELRNKDKYETLFRTMHNDGLIAKGMANFVNKMEWKYVFVLNSPDDSNRQAAHLFREYLKGFGICVLAQYEFVTDGSMEVILNSLVSAESQIVAVFAEPDQHIEDFLETKKDKLFTKQLQFIANRPWTQFSSNYRTMLANSVFFQASVPTINELRNYLNALDISSSRNPWLGDVYGELFDCDFPGQFSNRRDCTSPFSQLTTSSKYSQDIWALSTITAIYALAEGVHRTLQEKCGTNYNHVCSAFTQGADTREKLMAHMDDESFLDILNNQFKFIERESNQEVTLHRYTDIGDTPSEGDLSLDGEVSLIDGVALKKIYADSNIKSACDRDCLVCQDSDASIQAFSFIPGDMYIIGLFDVHKSGPTPFTCGEINDKHGTQLLEAFHFALNYVNNHQGIFADLGIQIGGIALDTCQSPSRAANLVANIHSGKLLLQNSGATISPRRIDSYVGPFDTESSIRVGDILNQLLVPQVSYGATGMDLLDREKYEYFLRSVPADDKMGRAIISYLKKFKLNNIQLVKSFDEIGEPGGEEFERLAELNLVCIKKKYQIGQSGDLEGDARKVIQSIMLENNADVIVMWMKNPLPILEAANQIEAVYKNFLFVATDKWGADPDYLKLSSIQNVLNAKNLILLDVETADVPGFDDFLAEKTPDNYNLNPWFKEFFEMHQKCDWDAGTCNQFKTIPRLDSYVQDPYVLYVVNAVFSAAMGIGNAVKELCGTRQSGVCNKYDTNGERRQKVLKHLKEVNFVDDTHQPFFFTDDGQSDRGFHFYNVTEGNPKFEYENVGSYNDSHFLKLDITYDNDYKARCDPTGLDITLEPCICPFKPDLPTRFMKKEEGQSGLTLVYIGDIHKEHPDDYYRCGKINTGVDLHRMLAFFYAIERINSNIDRGLPASMKLDGVALDSCTSSLRLGQDVYNILSGNKLCDSDDKGHIVAPSSIAAFIVDKDKNAIPVSTMLSAKGITSISPTATSASLDDMFIHKTFLRTQGSDQQAINIILEMTARWDWNMIGVIYSDTVGFQKAKEKFLYASKSRDMCVGSIASLSMNATDHEVHEVLDEVTQQVGVSGVVLFVEPEHFRRLMKSSREMGSTGIMWIVPYNWPTVEEDIQEYRSELSSSIWIQSYTALLGDFNSYLKQLTLNNRMGIPDDWFEDIYQTIHNCKILDIQDRTSKLYTKICNGDETISDDMLIHDPAILHVVMSVYAAAYGLNNIPICMGTELPISACLQLQDQKYELIYEGIRGARFEVLPELLGNKSFQFAFNRDGNGDAGYRIVTRKENGEAVHIGDYTPTGLKFVDNYETLIQQTNSFNQETDNSLPMSNCAPGATCKCHGPYDTIYYFTPVNVDNLDNVQVGQRYRDPDNGEIVLVEEVPDIDDRLDQTWAIILLAVAIVGAVVGFALFAYLLVMYPVRGGTSILGYIVSFGIVLMYIMVIPFIYHASDQVCAIRRFCLGLVYAIVYSALLVKLVDCCRVRGKNDAYNAKYSKLGRPVGLFFVTVFLVLVQVMINTQWLIMETPEMERVFYNEMYWPRCVPDDFYDEGLVLSLCYVMVLILVSFCLGIYTFTLNVNHRESRWIFGIVILSIPCWVIWCLVATIGAYKVRDAAVAVGLLINATFMLLLMPVRKLYLLNKYNKMIEEEDKQMMAGDGSEYGSVYGRQYDNRPRLHNTGSVQGSSLGYSSPRHPSERPY